MHPASAGGSVACLAAPARGQSRTELSDPEKETTLRPGNDVRIGCCGFPIARGAYFSRFALVEVQQTFYQPPRTATLAGWRAQAPAGFEFTLKAWQLITHEPGSPTYRRLKTPIAPQARDRYGSFRPSDEVMAAWRATLEAARALAASCVVFQCPASFVPSAEHVANMRAFFCAVRPEAEGLRLCWEPRGDWPRTTVTGLCRELGLELVVDPFKSPPPARGLRYFRLHGRDGYAYAYSDAELRELAALCRGTTYCLFNNTAMLDDATRFQRLVAGGP